MKTRRRTTHLFAAAAIVCCATLLYSVVMLIIGCQNALCSILFAITIAAFLIVMVWMYRTGCGGETVAEKPAAPVADSSDAEELKVRVFGESMRYAARSFQEINAIHIAENHYEVIHPALLAHSGCYSEALERHISDGSVHEEDVELVRNTLCLDSLARLGEDDGALEVKYRRVLPSGEVIWCLTSVLFAGEEGRSNGIATMTICDIDGLLRIEEREKLDLLEAKLRAEEASIAKTEFLSRMSHDIRTPMNGIVGLVDNSLRHLDDPRHLKENLEQVAHSSEHLLAIINELLDMSSIESGKCSLALKPFLMNDMVASCVKQVSLQANQQGHRVSVRYDVVHDELVGDENHLRQVFTNLLSNSVKYTKPGGLIEFAVRELDSQVDDMSACERNLGENVVWYEFLVKDNGIGIPEESRDQIFESFQRLDGARALQAQGTGLGLSIVRDLVDLMGGIVSVSSRLNEGSMFTVRLPLECALHSTLGEQSSTGIAAGDRSMASLPERMYPGRRALVVDDTPVNVMVAARYFKEFGMEVDTAENGEVAVEKFSSSPVGMYSLVMMDVRMPVLDGHDATRQIRALDREDAQTVPIIAMSANAYAEDVEAARAIGMVDYMTKPFKKGDLAAVLARHLA